METQSSTKTNSRGLGAAGGVILAWAGLGAGVLLPGCDDAITDADEEMMVSSPDGDETLPLPLALPDENEDDEFRWFSPSGIQELPAVGGEGGSDFGTLGYGVMYGFGGRSGARVDRLTFGFYQPQAHPGHYYEAGDPWWVSTVGGNGGGAFPWTTCPTGWAAIGYHGRSGARIDRFGLICAPLSNRFASPIYLMAYGGGGGSSFTRFCPGSKWLIGMRGRSGAEVDQLRGVCGWL